MNNAATRTNCCWCLPALVGLSLLAGCGRAIVGDWRMVSATPNREVFSIDHATFGRDGAFAATMTVEGLTADQTGTYDFNGFKLKLRPQGGGQRSYLANVGPGKLEIADGERRVVLRKCKPER